jgi:hypothetical protein
MATVCLLRHQLPFWHINQSINVTSVAIKFIEISCQPFTDHRDFMPAIHRKSLVWLLSTYSTSPSKTTIQIAIDGNLGHPHLLFAGSSKLLASNTSQNVLHIPHACCEV